MIHEAMILEYSGRYRLSSNGRRRRKLLIFFSLLGNLFVPWGVARALTPGRSCWPGNLPAEAAGPRGHVAVFGRASPSSGSSGPELLSVSFVLALLAVSSSFLLR